VRLHDIAGRRPMTVLLDNCRIHICAQHTSKRVFKRTSNFFEIFIVVVFKVA
jgi:hypothetical protein